MDALTGDYASPSITDLQTYSRTFKVQVAYQREATNMPWVRRRTLFVALPDIVDTRTSVRGPALDYKPARALAALHTQQTPFHPPIHTAGTFQTLPATSYLAP